MSLRQKLFLLLASIALVPMAVLAGLEFRASQNVADRLASENRNAIVADITQLLTRNVEANSAYLNGHADVVTLSLQLQAAAVERALRLPPPNVPLYFPESFDGPRSGWPPQTTLVRMGDSPQRLAVSAAVGTVMVPNGVDRAAVHDNLERLSAVNDTLRALDRENPGLFLGQFTALTNGERNNFPGHGNYPRGYDSRVRSWYRAARAAGAPLWTPPIFSASTKQLTFIAAMPVHGPDGRFAGVSAVEIPIVNLLRNLDRNGERQEQVNATSLGRLAGEVATILVVPVASPGSRRPDALRVIAQRSYQQQAANWTATPALETIDGGDPAIYRELIDDVIAGRSATVRMTYGGSDSLWAIGPVPALGAAILIVLPYHRILAAADAASLDVRAGANEQLRNSAIVALLMLICVAGIAYYVSGTATKPIRELAQVAARIGGGDLNARATVTGNDEIAALASAFNAMVPRLEAGLRMQHGLEIARAVQQNLLPLQPPSVPGFDIAGASEYCDETGGDYYDFVDLSPTGEGRVAIAVGDVSGHGIGAALLMASVRAALRTSIGGAEPPAGAMQRANRLLCADVDDGSFMTLVLTLVDRGAGKLHWVNAAHDPPLLYHRDSQTFLATGGADVPIGIDPDWPYAEHELALPAGDFVLAIGTDGIWETENAAGTPFGRERFRELLRSGSAGSAAELCRTVMREVTAFRGAVPPNDDVTLVVVAFTVGATSAAKDAR